MQNNIAYWLDFTIKNLETAEREVVAKRLLSALTGYSYTQMLTYPETPLTEATITSLLEQIKILNAGLPLAYLLKQADFWDMTLTVSEDTLIPRFDSELFIELALQYFKPTQAFDVLDLGTGSGAIAIALSREFKNARITATDKSEKALRIAKQNAKQWQKATIDFLVRDWLSGFTTHTFDLIVSNPPYIAPDDAHLPNLVHEPQSALVAAEAGFADLFCIAKQAKSVLRRGGWLFLEHGYQQAPRLQAYLADCGYQQIQTYQDLGNNPRITVGQVV